MGRLSFILLFCLSCAAVSHISSALAEDVAEFQVTIKAIGAAQTSTEDIDSRIGDLADKLRRLPFTAFKLQSEDVVQLSTLNRKKISLSNGQTICLRPIESSGDQITMWLKWKGKDGMSILDTRINFGLNETMVAGIEGQSEGTGTVLAITVNPKIS